MVFLPSVVTSSTEDLPQIANTERNDETSECIDLAAKELQKSETKNDR